MYEPLGRFERWGLMGAFALACLLTIGGILAVLSNRPSPVTFTIVPPAPTDTPPPTGTPSPVVVYVTGEVLQPNQLLTLPVGSRISDVVTSAGGFTEQADVEQVNLASVVRDGQQIHIPALGEMFAVPTGMSDATVFDELVDMNTATVEQLSELPGIGPALAQRIVDYRNANGPFKSFDDLDLVSGIGASIITNLRERVTFSGF